MDGHSVPLSRTLERSSGQEAEPPGTAMKLCDGPENVAKREWLELGVDDETKLLVDWVTASLSTESSRG